MPLLCLILLQDLAELNADDIEVRATAEARLKAGDPARVRELLAGAEDVETRFRAREIEKHLRRREVEARFAKGELLDGLRLLADGEDVETKTRRAEDRLKALLRERDPMGGDVLRPDALLVPQVEALLPWAYPGLVRQLGTSNRAGAILVFEHLGPRGEPALRWGLRSDSAAVRAESRRLLDRTLMSAK